MSQDYVHLLQEGELRIPKPVQLVLMSFLWRLLADHGNSASFFFQTTLICGPSRLYRIWMFWIMQFRSSLSNLLFTAFALDPDSKFGALTRFEQESKSYSKQTSLLLDNDQANFLSSSSWVETEMNELTLRRRGVSPGAHFLGFLRTLWPRSTALRLGSWTAGTESESSDSLERSRTLDEW